MSLKVPDALVERAKAGAVTDEEFLTCVQESLPYAWSVVTGLADRLASDTGKPMADNLVEPPDEASRAELLRLVASDSMRGAVERHFGVRMAFQNCHRVALFRPEATAQYEMFISPRAQLLNQTPELVSC